MNDLLDLQRNLWSQMTSRVADIEARVTTLAQKSERAEVAGATPRFATVAALPAGVLGMIATVVDAGAGSPGLYWHDGTSWQKVHP